MKFPLFNFFKILTVGAPHGSIPDRAALATQLRQWSDTCREHLNDAYKAAVNGWESVLMVRVLRGDADVQLEEDYEVSAVRVAFLEKAVCSHSHASFYLDAS